MVAKKEIVIRIVVEGPESSRKQALVGLLEDKQVCLRDIFDELSTVVLVRIAQAVHGRIYKRLHY